MTNEMSRQQSDRYIIEVHLDRGVLAALLGQGERNLTQQSAPVAALTEVANKEGIYWEVR